MDTKKTNEAKNKPVNQAREGTIFPKGANKMLYSSLEEYYKAQKKNKK